MSMICCSVMPRAANADGLTRTCSCRSCWPKMATLATPGTPDSRGLTIHRARYESSIPLNDFDVSPIISTRLDVDSGWINNGGLETLGREKALVRRSCTSCRARRTVVPGSK